MHGRNSKRHPFSDGFALQPFQLFRAERCNCIDYIVQSGNIQGFCLFYIQFIFLSWLAIVAKFIPVELQSVNEFETAPCRSEIT